MRRWGSRGAYSILDQALVSGANFVLSVLYARWLSADQYGSFAILLAVLLVAAGFHNALVLEPMSVLGPKSSQDRNGGYLSSLLVLHAAVVASLGLIIACVGLFFPAGNGIGPGLSPPAASLPFILSYWVLRRVFYLSGDARRAVTASIAYSASLGSLLFVPHRFISPSAGLFSMAAAATVASALAWRFIRPMWRPRGGLPSVSKTLGLRKMGRRNRSCFIG